MSEFQRPTATPPPFLSLSKLCTMILVRTTAYYPNGKVRGVLTLTQWYGSDFMLNQCSDSARSVQIFEKSTHSLSVLARLILTHPKFKSTANRRQVDKRALYNHKQITSFFVSHSARARVIHDQSRNCCHSPRKLRLLLIPCR